VLLAKGRGSDKQPGEFRTSQNWIGGTRPGNARYVPPPHDLVPECMGALEKFMHAERDVASPLLKAALAHVQFETIHPFLDGNGRVGRLLTSFLLCHDGVLKQPLLYLSLFLKQHRPVYYDLLQRVRTEGAWEEWLAFFFEGVAATADQAAQTVARVLKLFQENQLKIATLGSTAASTTRIHELLQRYPMLSVNRALSLLPEPPAFATANAAFKRLVDLGIAEEKTGGARNRVFAYRDYLAILAEGTEPL
jgi:Fic family protein